ncbi:hypothetical protein CIP107507_02180 [Corynebacterium diphtheriae]|uniref:AlbA family DNA-binding domain-containing protein n=1 Tax=Corynebacterium diphtheriae TaxID=1717 RepID=UPI0013CB028E|nr:ATP-binding protein [Corynebacterium diphtheriae]CAB0528423.1 hypothetical protein CIP107507_02180 [Corynebacterium diphtheriae]CAB0575804.1 hypothetical protein CIP107509_02427 [Corynebacterium diphtheriae]CAB0921626.1 hypothetical protein FRC0414_02316 [Corynebacterium diphtheriae]CAB1026442.1 hypothetical protein FRC0515_02397 [Corynebacterium diphtheriae]CAB1050960.1 hypothetical protein FRC0547_02428 [Corynebacterium diphtheriae]
MNWTLDSLTEQLAELRRLHRDSTDIEVKRASELPENLPETTCAFANMPSGGTIILGVDENRDFEVVGVADAAALEEALISQTPNSVKPAGALSRCCLPAAIRWRLRNERCRSRTR